jgi:alkylated DNA repair protein alkB family protein 1
MAPSPTHSAFRLAEKHFKNRATWALPALRGLPPDLCRPVLDVSRPANAEDDEVFLAGWWGEAYDEDADTPKRKKKASRKGKERARGERPDLGELPRVVLADGRAGYVVSEGMYRPQYLADKQAAS